MQRQAMNVVCHLLLSTEWNKMKEQVILSGILQEEKIKTLKVLKVDSLNWKTYFLDVMSDEKWVKEYPYSEMHGGGPPILKLIEKFPWE